MGRAAGATHMPLPPRTAPSSQHPARLQDCYHHTWGVVPPSCTHGSDAGVVCDAARVQVRLVGGPSARSGRLELLVAGQWGTVRRGACPCC